jgi:hypothetical protein
MEPPAEGEEKRGDEDRRSWEGRDCRVWMSMPETEMRDSWEAARRSEGWWYVVGDITYSSSGSGEVKEYESGVVASSFSSGIAEWNDGDRVKISFASEFCGLTAEMIAVAGLDLAVKEIGVEELRIVDRLGGFRLCDFFLW